MNKNILAIIVFLCGCKTDCGIDATVKDNPNQPITSASISLIATYPFSFNYLQEGDGYDGYDGYTVTMLHDDNAKVTCYHYKVFERSVGISCVQDSLGELK